MINFLIPFNSRGESGASSDNVLWQNENVYVMDNHRLALWCWFQKMEKGRRYNLLHIDAHPDLSESALRESVQHNIEEMSLETYRKLWQDEVNLPLFRWDNYLEYFLKKYPEQVGKTISATHHLGSKKELSEEIRDYDLVKFASGLFSEKKYINDLPWIVNLDLDYFFSAAPEKLELFSHSFVKSLSKSIRQGLENGMVQVLTISLSPECCGSWDKAEEMLEFLGEEIELLRPFYTSLSK